MFIALRTSAFPGFFLTSLPAFLLSPPLQFPKPRFVSCNPKALSILRYVYFSTTTKKKKAANETHDQKKRTFTSHEETTVLVGKALSQRLLATAAPLGHAYLRALFVTGHAIGSFAFCSQREKHRPIIPAAQTIWRLRQCFKKLYIYQQLFLPKRSGSLNS